MNTKVLHIHYKQSSCVGKFMNDSTYSTLLKAIKKYAPARGRVLDVGCGRGELLKAVSDLGYVAYGCDMDEICVQMGAAYGAVQQLSVDELAPEKFDGKFDIIVMSHVLEHVEAPKATVKQLMKLSNKYILISIPNPYFLPNIIKSLFRLQISNVNTGHLYSWDWYHFKTFIEVGTGGKVVEWFYDSVALPLNSSTRNVLARLGIIGLFEQVMMPLLFPRFCRSITAVIEVPDHIE